MDIDVVKCGANHSLVLTSNGEVYAWGNNRWGQVGNGCNKDQLTPIKVMGFNNEKVIMISCGGRHSLALTKSRSLFGWGENDFGELGIGNTVDSNEPKLIEINDLTISKISCGHSHSLLLTSDGEIYAFGHLLGDPMSTGNLLKDIKSEPFKLETEIKFIDIASHFSSDIIVSLSDNGVYYLWNYFKEEKILKPVETVYHSFNEIFSNFTQFSVYIQSSEKLINFKDELFRCGYYEEKFNEIRKLGNGSFGTFLK